MPRGTPKKLADKYDHYLKSVDRALPLIEMRRELETDLKRRRAEFEETLAPQKAEIYRLNARIAKAWRKAGAPKEKRKRI